MADVNWGGYTFKVCTPEADWKDIGGVYVFAGKNSKGSWVAKYIGKAKSFADRLPGHERWDEAVKLGATHIHARAVSKEADRDKIEGELIKKYQPPLNVQKKSKA